MHETLRLIPAVWIQIVATSRRSFLVLAEDADQLADCNDRLALSRWTVPRCLSFVSFFVLAENA